MSRESRRERRERREASQPRRGRSLLLGLGLLVVPALVVGVGTWMRSRPTPDPTRSSSDLTRAGPERWIKLEPFRVEPAPQGGWRLLGGGTTNLPDGAWLSLSLRTSEELLAAQAACRDGRFAVDLSSRGAATNGKAYALAVRFRIEEQAKELCEQLHYQPRVLETSGSLLVSAAVDPDAELRPRLKKLIKAANNAKDAGEAARLAADAAAFEREVWISTLLPGIRRIRAGLESGIHDPTKLDLVGIQKAAIEADVLADVR